MTVLINWPMFELPLRAVIRLLLFRCHVREHGHSRKPILFGEACKDRLAFRLSEVKGTNDMNEILELFREMQKKDWSKSMKPIHPAYDEANDEFMFAGNADHLPSEIFYDR